MLEETNNNDCIIKNCKYCSKDNLTCFKCDTQYLFYNNGCFQKCPKETKKIALYDICVSTKCKIPNCEICQGNFCKKCYIGKYLYNNQCVSKCPKSLIASRIDFTCKFLKDNPYFWIYPSKGSCKGTCNKSFYNLVDCSCEQSCLQKGNCCEDFSKNCNTLMHLQCDLCDENNCLNGICSKCKENSQSLNGICQCNNRYQFDIEKNICIEVEFLYNTSSKKNNKKKEIDQLVQKNNKIKPDINYFFNKHLGETYKNMKSIFSKENHLNSMSLYLNGNIKSNNLTNNINTVIKSNSSGTSNSFNNNNSTKNHLDSLNEIKNIIKKGNINQNINYGSIIKGNIDHIHNDIDLVTSRKNSIEIDKNIHVEHNKQFSIQEKQSLNDNLNHSVILESENKNEEKKQVIHKSNQFENESMISKKNHPVNYNKNVTIKLIENNNSQYNFYNNSNPFDKNQKKTSNNSTLN